MASGLRRGQQMLGVHPKGEEWEGATACSACTLLAHGWLHSGNETPCSNLHSFAGQVNGDLRSWKSFQVRSFG